MSNAIFLTAEWRNLLNITYAVAPELLQKHIPNGLELVIEQGKAFVSFVAFEFINTRLLGWSLPFHRNFPEINLRFYVKAPNGKPAVIFLREFVPKYAVACIANRVYNEPYSVIPLQCTSAINEEQAIIEVEYHFKVAKQWFSAKAQAHSHAIIPEPNSIEHFFKEHDTGFGIDKQGNTLHYTVAHPIWPIYPLQSYELNLDFELIYGKKWAILNHSKPINVLLAAGSAISVYRVQIFQEQV